MADQPQEVRQGEHDAATSPEKPRETEAAFPSLPPAPLPEIDKAENQTSFALDSSTGPDPAPESTDRPWNQVAARDGTHDRAPAKPDQVNPARPGGGLPTPEPSRRGSSSITGSPSHKATPHSPTEAFADDESSDTSWDLQEAIKSRTVPAARKRPHQQQRATTLWQSSIRRRAAGEGAVTDRKAWLPLGFGDDLDDESDSDAEHAHHPSWRLRLAPLNTPIHRRIQTLVVSLHVLGMGLTFSFFCFLCTNPLLWPIIAIYLVSIQLSTAGTDGKTSRRVQWLRKARIWNFFAAYFPVQLHKTADLPPTRKYIFAVHPHGIISHGAFAAFATEALGFSEKFPGITNSLLTLNGNFKTPLYREYLLAMGLLSVSKESITNALTRGGTNGEGMGNAVSIVIGGAREALEAQPKTMRLIMKRRGFCRMALRTGADLVPVICFGENDLYRQWGPQDHPRFRRIQMKALAYMGFSVPVLQGRGVFNYDFGVLPHRRPVNVVVGAPIKVQQCRGGADLEQQVEDLHKLYCHKLIELYDEYKDVYFRDRKEDMKFIDLDEDVAAVSGKSK